MPEKNEAKKPRKKYSKRKAYTPALKAKFYVELKLSGGKIKATAKKLNIGYETAKKWAATCPEEIEQKINEKAVEAAGEAIYNVAKGWSEVEIEGIQATLKLMREASGPGEAAKCAATARDKLNLISGQATKRIEKKGLNVNLDINERRALMGEIEDKDTLIRYVCDKVKRYGSPQIQNESMVREIASIMFNQGGPLIEDDDSIRQIAQRILGHDTPNIKDQDSVGEYARRILEARSRQDENENGRNITDSMPGADHAQPGPIFRRRLEEKGSLATVIEIKNDPEGIEQMEKLIRENNGIFNKTLIHAYNMWNDKRVLKAQRLKEADVILTGQASKPGGNGQGRGSGPVPITRDDLEDL